MKFENWIAHLIAIGSVLCLVFVDNTTIFQRLLLIIGLLAAKEYFDSEVKEKQRNDKIR